MLFSPLGDVQPFPSQPFVRFMNEHDMVEIVCATKGKTYEFNGEKVPIPVSIVCSINFSSELFPREWRAALLQFVLDGGGSVW